MADINESAVNSQINQASEPFPSVPYQNKLKSIHFLLIIVLSIFIELGVVLLSTLSTQKPQELGSKAASTKIASKITSNSPIVGAIRWDAWITNPPASADNEKELNPLQWHYRVPYFGKIISDNKVEFHDDDQATIDQEILYAVNAKLNYFAFDFMDGTAIQYGAIPDWNYGLDFYLTSQYKSQLNFALILFPDSQWLGLKEDWPTKMVPELVNFMSNTSYQKVLGNRPLLYFFYASNIGKYFGSNADAKVGLDLLRQKAVEAGLGSPYIVAFNNVNTSKNPYLKEVGFDAVSVYTAANNNQGPNEYPYSNLAALDKWYWDWYKSQGYKVIPTVNTGSDCRPIPNRTPCTWWDPGTPQEIADNLLSAAVWNLTYPTVGESNSIIIYAWNEFTEGGWLVPTLSEGTARLDAMAQVLSQPIPTPTPTPTPTPKPTCVPQPTCPKGAACELALPPGGWCTPTPKPTPTPTPKPTCVPKPTCPKGAACELALPPGGWCTPTPTPKPK